MQEIIFLVLAASLISFIVHHTFYMYINHNHNIYANTHYLGFSLHLSMSSCFDNHSMEMLTFLQLGSFGLHVQSLLKLLLLFQYQNDSTPCIMKKSLNQGWPHFKCSGQKNRLKKLGGHKYVSKKLGGQNITL